MESLIVTGWGQRYPPLNCQMWIFFLILVSLCCRGDEDEDSVPRHADFTFLIHTCSTKAFFQVKRVKTRCATFIYVFIFRDSDKLNNSSSGSSREIPLADLPLPLRFRAMWTLELWTAQNKHPFTNRVLISSSPIPFLKIESAFSRRHRVVNYALTWMHASCVCERLVWNS